MVRRAGGEARMDPYPSVLGASTAVCGQERVDARADDEKAEREEGWVEDCGPGLEAYRHVAVTGLLMRRSELY